MKTIKIKGENYRIIKEYLDSYFAVSEIGFKYKTIPKLQIVK